MFEIHKPRYMTSRIAEELSEEHLTFIIRYMDKHQKNLTDYLQIFDFYVENDQQWVVQRQEVPEKETTIFVKLDKATPIERKVWVMDQEDYVMVLFAEDY